MTRASLLLLRLAAAAEVFRVGYMVGSYKQGMDCTQRLVSLRSALGGEISAIIRERVGGEGGRACWVAGSWLASCPSQATSWCTDCGCFGDFPPASFLTLHHTLAVSHPCCRSRCRPQEPQHPLLRFERPPPEQLEDGSRPRIQNEANRQAQIAHLQRELGQAKAGEVVDRCEWLRAAGLCYHALPPASG